MYAMFAQDKLKSGERSSQVGKRRSETDIVGCVFFLHVVHTFSSSDAEYAIAIRE